MKLSDLKKIRDILACDHRPHVLAEAAAIIDKEIERVQRKDQWREFEREHFMDDWTRIGKSVRRGVDEMRREYEQWGRYRELCVGDVYGLDVLLAPKMRGRRP